MNILNISLIRFSQALLGIFFVFVVSGYFGLLLLFPLAVIYHITNLFSGIGLNAIVAFLFSIPVSSALFYYGYKIEGLYKIILDTGLQLINIAKTQVLAFEGLLPGDKSRKGPGGSEAGIEH